MAKSRLTATILLTALLLAGCAGTDDRSGVAGDPAPAPVGLLTDLSPGDAQVVAEAVNQFGFDLFGEVTADGGNTVTSPLSAAVLLSMVLAGAEGDTADAMGRVLHLDDPRDVRVGALLAEVSDTDEVVLSTGNGLWAAPAIPFEPDYLDFVRDHFGATVDNADLAQPETVATIDAWVAEQTQGRIERMAADLGLPNPDAALVLLNTVYFLAEWTTRFDADATSPQPFTLAGGDRTEVAMMHLRGEEFPYADRDGYQLLRLPYGEQGRYGMEVFLPDPGSGLADLLAGLDAAEWGSAVAALSPRTIDELALPRFTLEWDGRLNDALVGLGMGPALDRAEADFAAMSSADLFLDQVVQKTFIEVDEAGTEAAAATGGSMGITSAQPTQHFRVDRPFVFTVSDTETGTILFLAAVADPSS